MHERPYDPPRRRRGCVLAVLVAGALLTSCADANPPTPAPSPVPSLTQDQQDDEAFQGLVEGFLDLPFEGETADELQPFLTGEALEDEVREISRYQSEQQTVVGEDTFYGFAVTARGSGYMVGQACLDVSGTRVLGSGGEDATPKRSPTVSVQLKAVRGEDDAWRISDIVPNDEVHACA